MSPGRKQTKEKGLDSGVTAWPGSSHGKHDVSTNEVVDPEEQQLALSGDYNPPPGGDLSILMAATVCAAEFRQKQSI